MKDKIGIYKILNIINNNIYVGSSKNIYKRWNRHKKELNKNIHSNTFLQRAWNKYGEKNFKFEIIEECELTLLLEREQFYLDKKPDYNIGLNACGGDNLTNNPNREEIIKKITKASRDRYNNMSYDEKVLLSNNYKGEKNPNFGNYWTEEMKKNISKKLKDFYKTHNNYLYGKTFKEYFGEEKAKEIIKKISESASTRIGEKNGFFGKKHTKKSKKIMKDKRLGKYCGEQNIPFMINNIEYRSLGEASKKLNIPITTIRWRIKSKNKKFINYFYII